MPKSRHALCSDFLRLWTNACLMAYQRISKLMLIKTVFIVLSKKKKTNSMVWVRQQTIPTERPPLVGEWLPTFADKGCHVVSVTDPYVRILDFLDFSVTAFTFQVIAHISGILCRCNFYLSKWDICTLKFFLLHREEWLKETICLKNKLPCAKHQAVNMHVGVDVQLYIFLNFTPDGGEWSIYHPNNHTTKKKSPGTK
jgi:hypothetical protein